MPKIKCPNCGESITVSDLEDMEKEVMTCPFCYAAVSVDDLSGLGVTAYEFTITWSAAW